MTQLARCPSLTGRGVVMTGGATGIGEELVTQFVAQGAQVGFVDVDVSAGKVLVRRLAGDATTPPLFIAADITDIHALEAAIDVVAARFCPIIVLINNAANDQRHKIEATTPAGMPASP